MHLLQHLPIVLYLAIAVTMPHGRPVRFWAKAALFNIPVIRDIVTSSGALPVHRSPFPSNMDTQPKLSNRAEMYGDTHNILFDATLASLTAGQVIGLFPKGPHIPTLIFRS